ncbi:Gag-pol Polyprotein [Phytophthora megakarya]|uniref:Gag-pol Polyprotein n=1 Tax=Phytophthora megakarya TaxID=4795 RepID=A0A225VLA4_9STRA|nr:Gag-pol Polyprotein [Phytophthora megakarya]
MFSQQIAAQDFNYRFLVISLLYLVRGTQPDIANVVRELSKNLACYNKTHWVAARRMLKYLKGTSTYGLLLDGYSRPMTYEVYTDASLECQTNERMSVIDYVISMAGSSVSWCRSKQSLISLSTAEAELIVLSEGAKESEWLWYLLREMGFPQEKPVWVWCDSKAAFRMVKNPGNHKVTKYTEIRFLFTKGLVEEARLEIQYCSTSDMAADILTKALSTGLIIKVRELIGVKDLKITGDI